MQDSKEEKEPFQPEYIDVEKVIENKSPKLRKALPGFVIRYLKRIVHQDDLNEFLSQYGHLTGLPFIAGALETMNTKLEVIGAENIPKSGKAIVASNHPLGGLDGLALMLTVGTIRNDLIFPVNDILMNIKNLEPLFIPINKHGSNMENLKIINDTFASDRIVCYFPAGLVSRKRKGIIKDLEWKPTFITKARRFKRDVIPTHISGRNTNFFYNLANWRKRLKIKSNIEMLYLVDEFYKYRNKTITITFGKPVSFETFNKQKTAQGWAAALHDYIYFLKDNPNQPFVAD
ncbi:MAG: 1-acyl-sn-glycerol-3-phosphate acyltransferase [Bacteroidales bacterium]|nr:1-acyl-sn-glycerol-3-phosphate acyltransferase [Bacteroidales bacterium]